MIDFKKMYEVWFNRWDERVNTQDDLDNEELLRSKLDFIFYKIEKLLTSSISKASDKATKGFEYNSKEYCEAFYKAVKEVEEKEFYKDLKRCSQYATAVRGSLNDIFEIKHRRGSEIFKLRAENAKLRIELNNLKNNINGNN